MKPVFIISPFKKITLSAYGSKKTLSTDISKVTINSLRPIPTLPSKDKPVIWVVAFHVSIYIYFLLVDLFKQIRQKNLHIIFRNFSRNFWCGLRVRTLARSVATNLCVQKSQIQDMSDLKNERGVQIHNVRSWRIEYRDPSVKRLKTCRFQHQSFC